MLAEYLPLAILIGLATGLGFLVVALGHLFGPRHPSLKKSLPYESGMVPYGPGARRVNVRFYLVAVLFILFDLLIVFLLPWAVAFDALGEYGLVAIIIFVVILLVGYVYAWKKGALEWE
jgi:NADH-quinone oxidoreductase subunit A